MSEGWVSTFVPAQLRLLIATRITRDEMNFSMQHGRGVLLDRLQKAGIGQISILDRPSVVRE